MRLAYADEAGISHPKQEPFAVVAAVIVNADQQLTAVERYLDRLVERHIPAEQRPGFVFHAKELFLGGKVIKRNDPNWPDEKRFAIGDDLAAIPKRFNLPISIGFVERAKFPLNPPPGLTEDEKAVGAHVTSFMVCAMTVEHWVRDKAPNEVCMMIVEDNDRARQLIRHAQRAHQDPRIEATLSPESREHFPFRKIKEDPFFQPKRSSSPLQIADFIAYVFKRFLMQDERYHRYLEPMWPHIVRLGGDKFPLSGKRLIQRKAP